MGGFIWANRISNGHTLLRLRLCITLKERCLNPHYSFNSEILTLFSAVFLSNQSLRYTEETHGCSLLCSWLSFCVFYECSENLRESISCILLHISSSQIYTRQFSLREGERSFTGNAKTMFYKIEIDEKMLVVP